MRPPLWEVEVNIRHLILVEANNGMEAEKLALDCFPGQDDWASVNLKAALADKVTTRRYWEADTPAHSDGSGGDK